MLEEALSYAARGWPVFPCEPGGKRPLGRLAPHGCNDATLDIPTIRAWWQTEPAANIGVACGGAALYVLDVDGPEGEASIVTLQKRHGRLADTLWQRTGGGGWQGFFTNPSRLGNTAGKLGPGIDTRGVGGYVLVPPSIHPYGTPYAWWNEGTPIANIPPWMHRLLTYQPRPITVPAGPSVTDRYVAAAIEREAENVSSAPPGQRNQTLNVATFSLARLIGQYLTVEQLYAAMHAAATACGLHSAEADRTIRSAINARQGARNGERR